MITEGVITERGRWKTIWRIYKYDSEEKFRAGEVSEILEFEGNILLNEGINQLWTLACGGSGTNYGSANARIGVGDGTTEESATQTGLQGTNKAFAGMDTGYPTYGSGQKAVWRATFGGTVANFDWNEITVVNAADDTGQNLNRKVQSMGTKAPGSVWTAELTITLS